MSIPKDIVVLPGKSHPIGATVYNEGINFCLFSRNALNVELLLFNEDHSTPYCTILLDPEINKSFYYWHCFIPDLKHGQIYAYRVYGPYDPSKGWRFNGKKVLIDPYSKGVVTDTYNRDAAVSPRENCAEAVKSVALDTSRYDWEGDQPLNHAFSESVIYEMHVGGFTKHPSSGVSEELRGTYRGVIEKIPYLKELGITAIELLPVQQFDPFDSPSDLLNYWGYSPMAFFAPHNGYSNSNNPAEVIDEFRDMVKALHKAGIEVILDVVFNHSAEGDESGPTFGFRGIENLAYYLLAPDKSKYHNFSGTGNTFNANQSIVRRLIRDCLRYWVSVMHVDGFRFDLASVLSRDENGQPLENPPLLWSIESDPELARTKIIAEAWDVETFQLGKFKGEKWAEWNGVFRDDVRKFVKGDDGMIHAIKNKITASPDVFNFLRRDPNRSINFITAHDGFTLNDLVSYNYKHNEANKEDNRDGTNENYSWNCGVEGPTTDNEIEALRARQIKNFFTLLMIAQGTPMFTMGDEIRRTQMGNNNAYCQDNEISWFNWASIEKNKSILEFVKQLIKFNLSTPFFQEKSFWGLASNGPSSKIAWHGTRLGMPDLADYSHTIAFTLTHMEQELHLHVMINAYWEPLGFEIPKLDKGRLNWHRIIDTAKESPEDIQLIKTAEEIKEDSYLLLPRSIVVLLTQHKKE